MLLTNKRMGKMSEASIAQEYTVYLQKVMIVEMEDELLLSTPIKQHGFLSYDEFKDYTIMALVGRHDYVDNLAYQIQQQNLTENA